MHISMKALPGLYNAAAPLRSSGGAAPRVKIPTRELHFCLLKFLSSISQQRLQPNGYATRLPQRRTAFESCWWTFSIFFFLFFFYYKSPFPLDIFFYIRHIYRMIRKLRFGQVFMVRLGQFYNFSKLYLSTSKLPRSKSAHVCASASVFLGSRVPRRVDIPSVSSTNHVHRHFCKHSKIIY